MLAVPQYRTRTCEEHPNGATHHLLSLLRLRRALALALLGIALVIAATASAAIGSGPGLGQMDASERTLGALRAAGKKDAHHVIQDAVAKKLPGYNTNAAPGVQLPGPSTTKGTLHYNATQTQRQRGGGTYAAERRIGARAQTEALSVTLLSFVPWVGEGGDIATIADPGASTVAKVIAYVGLALGIVTGGSSPNFGSAARVMDDLADASRAAWTVPRSLSSAAKRIAVRGGGHLAEGTKVTGVQQIARGSGIDVVKRLVGQYGGKAKAWRKLKGTGSVETPSGAIRQAEVHWYEAHGVGRVEFKVKRWLD